MLEIKNKAQVFRQMDDWLAAVEAEIVAVAKGMAREALAVLLENSPQYSGDFAANWNISIGEKDVSFQPLLFGDDKAFPSKDPFIAGDAPAISYALAHNAGRLDGFQLGQTIWITNAAAHDQDYAWMIENNLIKFRDGNAGEPVFHALQHLQIRYGTIDKSRAQQLTGGLT
jgi:hypothetical protein